MPVSRTRPAPELERLRPYTFHRIDLSPTGAAAGHMIGTCPFCGRDGKFSVDMETGLWRCFVCASGSVNGGGNGLVFTRLLYENVLPAPPAVCDRIAQDRSLLQAGTVSAWGIAIASGGTWLIPGYGPDGRLDQVYRRTRVQDGDGEWTWRLLPTPGIWPEGKVHALHLPAGDFDLTRPCVDVFEGPWDGMCAWEVRDILGETNIIAVPGCTTWRDEWTQMCRGKHVRLWFDSDHPRCIVPGGKTSRAGYDGMARVARKLSGIAASVRYIKWGDEGYIAAVKSGWDVRDELSGATTLDGRREVMTALLDQVEDAPREWFCAASPIINGHPRHEGSVESLPCSTWEECEDAWKTAMFWREDLGDAAKVLLAVCASTPQAGSQLFLDLIGSPGSAKTTLCQGLLVSGHCIHLENVTKLISGWKKPDDAEKDCSFLARSNGKTWITCEFDLLGTSPEYHQLMGKVRRIFDGSTSATYGNDDKDRIYTALRTPWIRAGTQRMMDRMADYDQSQLGDRFIRFIMSEPNNEDRRSIARSAMRSERLAMVSQVNGTAGSLLDEKTRIAHALTGGYVDWLRANIEYKIAALDVPPTAEDYCIDLAELCADLRARPNEDKRKLDTHDCKELPTRLARQNIRLASCLAVVMNRTTIDADVLRVMRKVALDTAFGASQDIVRWLCSPNPRSEYQLYQETGGIGQKTLEMWLVMPPERAAKYLTFLQRIGVLEWRAVAQSTGAWVLTDRVYDLYLRVLRGTT